MISSQPPNFSAILTQDQPVERQPAAQIRKHYRLRRYYAATAAAWLATGTSTPPEAKIPDIVGINGRQTAGSENQRQHADKA